MHKGMCSALWVLFFALLTACHHNSEPPPPPPPPEPNQVELSGQIMLGPVLRGHSLEVLVLDANGKVLDKPKVGLDGSYGSILKDYDGIVYLQVKSNNPKNCSSGDYIDEATAKPKCLRSNTLLSATTVKSGSTDNQAKIHSTPLTTIAVISLGVTADHKGITPPKNLSKETITNANKVVAKVFGLGDQSIAEYTPKSIVTTDQKFQKGDAYAHALAAISGIEARDKEKNLNSIVKQITSSIDKENGELNLEAQNMMLKGVQRTAETLIEKSADRAILAEMNKNQSIYKKSIMAVDLINAPKPPVFTNTNKTAHTKPTWLWKSGGTGGNNYRFVFGTETNIDTKRNWKNIDTNSFKPSDSLKLGKYILRLQQAHASKPNIWSAMSESIIEVVANSKGLVSIEGEAKQYQTLKAKVSDKDGVVEGTVSYQWYRGNEKIAGANNYRYTLTEADVDEPIKMTVDYTDKLGTFEKNIKSKQLTIDNVDDKPVLRKIDDFEFDEDDQAKSTELSASDIDSDEKKITYKLINPDNTITIAELEIKNKTLTIKPKENQHGEQEITVRAISGTKTDEKKFKLTIKSKNDAPIIKTSSLKPAMEDSAYQQLLKFEDVDSNVLFVTLGSNTPKWISFPDGNEEITLKNPINGIFTTSLVGTPGQSAINDGKSESSYIFSIDVTDAKSATYKSTNFSIKVINTDQKGIVNIDGKGEQYGKLTATLIDKDGFSAESYKWFCDGDLVSNTDELTLKQEHVNKNIDVKVSYTDKRSLKVMTASHSFEKSILNVNDQPILTNKTTIKNITIYQDQTKSYEYSFNDIDGDSLKFSYESLPDWVQREASNNKVTLTITPKNQHVGKYENIKIRGTDDDRTYDETNAFFIDVININDQPQFITSKMQNAKEGEVYSAQVQILDVDEGSKATYKLNKGNNNVDVDIEINDHGFIEFTPKNHDENYDVNFKVIIDDKTGAKNAINEKEFTITVIADNDTSKFSSEPLTYAHVNENYSYTIEIEDPDSTKRLTVTEKPDWLELDKLSDSDNLWTLNGMPTSEDSALTSDNSVSLSTHDGITQQFNINLFEFKNASTTIKLCFEGNNALMDVPDALKKAMSYIKEVVDNTWSKSTAVKFDGWDKKCTSNANDLRSEKRAIIRIERVSQDLEIKRKRGRSSYNAEEHKIVLIENISSLIAHKPDSEIFEHDIVHEFGHLLGFPHEHERLDTYRAGNFEDPYTAENQSENICKYITYGKPADSNNDEPVYFYSQNSKNARIKQKLKLISYQDWQQSPYDPFSIMNYCENGLDYEMMRVADSFALTMKKSSDIKNHYDTPSFQKQDDDYLTLSYEDQKRAQRFYGAPLDSSSDKHLLKNGEFFTGLYKKNHSKNSELYEYYENGVKKKVVNYIMKSEEKIYNPLDYKRNSSYKVSLKELETGKHFNLKHNYKKGNFRYSSSYYDYKFKTLYLYKKNAQYLEPVNYPIAFCDSATSTDDKSGEVRAFEQDLEDDPGLTHFAGITQNCEFITKENYSDYSFFYYDSSYGLLKEFNIEFCKKNIQGDQFDLNGTKLYFIDTNICYDFMDHWRWSDNTALYINGVTFNGNINNLPEKFVHNGLKKQYQFITTSPSYTRELQTYKHWNPFLVDYDDDKLSTYKRSRIRQGIREGLYYGFYRGFYYIKGEKASDVTKVDRDYKWLYTGKSEVGPFSFSRNMIFAKLDNELYLDGILFTGSYNDNIYKNGILQQD